MSKHTKQKMINALMDLSKHHRIDNITVTELIGHCKTNRKTFYYHFSGIGSLLSWYILSISEATINERTSPTTWREAYVDVLNEFLNNKEFLVNALTSKYYGDIHKDLYPFFFSCIRKNLGEVIGDIQKQAENSDLTADKIETIINFYVTILQATTEQWIINGMVEKPKAYADMLYGIFNDSIYQVVRVIVENKSFYTTSG